MKINLDELTHVTLEELNTLHDSEVARVATRTPEERIADRARSAAHFSKLGLPTLQEYLDLSDADMLVMDTRTRLARALKARRNGACMTQQELAHKMETQNSRIARAESAS